MVQIIFSIKNTFVHDFVDTPGCVDLASNARRRASSTPARVTLDTAEKEQYIALAFGVHSVGELLLLPHDGDDYVSMHVHHGPSPLDMDVEGMLGCRVQDTDIDDCCGLSTSQAEDETIPDFIDLGIGSEKMDDYTASSLAGQGLTYGAQLPSDNYRENPTRSSTCMNAAPMCPHHGAQRQLLSTFTILPRQAQRDSHDFVAFDMEFDDSASEDYSASSPAYQDLPYGTQLLSGAQLPSNNYQENLMQSTPCISAAPMTPHQRAQRELFSTFPPLPRETQRDSYMQSHSGYSPTAERSNAKHEEMQGEETRTTVMLMNVPRRYTSTKLMCTIDSEGFAGMYDFIYIPMDFKTRSSIGCAFVNLLDPLIATRFGAAFDGFSGWLTTSKNVCRAHWASKLQGLQANIDHYRNDSVMAASVPHEYKPRIFKHGIEVSFPPPCTKASVANRRSTRSRRTGKH
eukprot:TRINITY_DN9328_c0_g1_i4.p1 TRINITY_DN9328_c0_g1~~TRINITY_DN9328_c0_g1_i4.p1  ORF type:complete len:458 (+),score=45.51 TRINITY_DN9328_c0_g1_i4:43-1416(+)